MDRSASARNGLGWIGRGLRSPRFLSFPWERALREHGDGLVAKRAGGGFLQYGTSKTTLWVCPSFKVKADWEFSSLKFSLKITRFRNNGAPIFPAGTAHGSPLLDWVLVDRGLPILGLLGGTDPN